MSATLAEWTSFSQLIQDLLSGPIRRNRFSQWELDLLLDLQAAQLRKPSRLDALRRYQKAVLLAQAGGLAEPPRFADFLKEMAERRAAASGGASQ